MALLACACGGARDSAAPGTLRIAVVPKGSTHEHWKRVHIGAEKAARRIPEGRHAGGRALEGADARGRSRAAGAGRRRLHQPARERHRAGAARQPRALRPVEEAAQSGIPTVIFDSALADPAKAVSYVSTDNGKGGRLAADRMGELLKGTGTVLMLRYQEGSAATEERERGFLQELKAKFPGITVISSDQYAGADPRHRQARLGESAEPVRRQGRRHLHAERVVDGGHAARAAGHRQGRRDHLRRLRLQRQLHRAAAQKAS